MGDTGMVILVVDDEPDAREIARIVLERGGHEVLVARHPDEALQVLNRADVDIVLTDLHMPRMDGQQLARTIADLYPDTPCIVWSALADEEEGVMQKDMMRLSIEEWVAGAPKDDGEADEIELDAAAVEEERA